MNRTLSIDPSGTGTTGIYFRNGQQEEFNCYHDQDWQKHYEFIVSLVKVYQPNILLYESTNYVRLRGKDMTSLFKLLGALAVLPVEQIKGVPVNQVKTLKGQLLKGTKQIPGLEFAKGRGKEIEREGLIPSFKPQEWEVKEKGVYYQGELYLFFYDLFSYKKARGGRAKTVSEIVYEEAIPIDQEFLPPNPYSWSSWFLSVFEEQDILFILRQQAEKLKEQGKKEGVKA
ncbi:5637_t:CDS:2 [Entrophospora sp. SA101]|nr:8430_t:CDS:2 [Entrophospora sp. SA101]CAJ0848170.1 5637_t:CDS:2 [Entrophospora sp. SA101]